MSPFDSNHAESSTTAAASRRPVMITLSMCDRTTRRFESLPCDQLPPSVERKNAALVGEQRIPASMPARPRTGVNAAYGNTIPTRGVDSVFMEHARSGFSVGQTVVTVTELTSEESRRSSVAGEVHSHQRGKFTSLFRGLRISGRSDSAPDLDVPPPNAIGVRERTKAIGAHLRSVRLRISKRVSSLLRKTKDSGHRGDVEELPRAVRVTFGDVNFGEPATLAQSVRSVSPFTRPLHGDELEVEVVEALLSRDSAANTPEAAMDDGSMVAHHEISPPGFDESVSLASTRHSIDSDMSELRLWHAVQPVHGNCGHEGWPFYGGESPPPVSLFANNRGVPCPPTPPRENIFEARARANELYRRMKARCDTVLACGGFDEDKIDQRFWDMAAYTTEWAVGMPGVQDNELDCQSQHGLRRVDHPSDEGRVSP